MCFHRCNLLNLISIRIDSVDGNAPSYPLTTIHAHLLYRVTTFLIVCLSAVMGNPVSPDVVGLLTYWYFCLSQQIQCSGMLRVLAQQYLEGYRFPIPALVYVTITWSGPLCAEPKNIKMSAGISAAF